MADLSDAQLLKRAKHGGRNLSVLAIFASLLGIGLLVALVKGAPLPFGLLSIPVTLVATAYWFLAVAAYRGDPKAVGIVVVLAGIHICFNFVAAGVAAARTGSEIKFSPLGLFLSVLVMVALGSSRKVLLELQDRGLWERVFAPARPTAKLCNIGLILIITGFVTLYAGLFSVSQKAAEQRKAEMVSVTAFTRMINQEERELIQAVGDLETGQRAESVEKALAKVASLEQCIRELKAAPENRKLTPVLATYGNAVRQWKNGLILLKGPTADADRAQKLLEAGDKLRIDACAEFKRQYGARQRPADSGI